MNVTLNFTAEELKREIRRVWRTIPQKDSRRNNSAHCPAPPSDLRVDLRVDDAVNVLKVVTTSSALRYPSGVQVGHIRLADSPKRKRASPPISP